MAVDAGQGALLPGKRIVVIGSSCAGKSTLAARLGETLGLPFVELDGLFWRPGWQEPPDSEFRAAIADATASGRWVVAGNYLRHTMPTIWPDAETVIWLDFGLPRMTWRILRRSWRRWRNDELLWGTNRERFWPQLKVWSPKDSLIAFNISTHRRRRRQCIEAMRDPRWSGLRFVRLTSPDEVREFIARVETNGEEERAKTDVS